MLKAAIVTLLLAGVWAGDDDSSGGYVSATTSSGASVRLEWVRWPGEQDLMRTYPRRALRETINGEVDLLCRVRPDGGLFACVIMREAPVGYGFSGAALSLAPQFRLEPVRRLDPRAFDGMRVPVSIHWNTGSHLHLQGWVRH
jgi:hypothetical protein